MKRVLTIQDLSCMGRCSLTVALPVLSAMGSQCTVLPTAVLSTHTGFPAPHVLPLTDHIAQIDAHWQTLDARFDAVSVGYLADARQAGQVLPILQRCRTQGSLIIADPAMGDHGRLYRGLGETHVEAMRHICRSADILLPNVTEAALLTGTAYRETPDEAYLQELAERLLGLGARSVIITGFLFHDGQIGFYGKDRAHGAFAFRGLHVPRRFHGTGDLFAAVFTGSLMAGRSVEDAGILAASFVRRCVEETPCVTPYGVEFEPQLPYLWELLQKR